MELITAKKDGWPKLRETVFRRDGGCVALQWRWFRGEGATDMCRDSFGNQVRWNVLGVMEADHVTDRRGIRRDDEAHLITVCPWHHRGSGWRIDTKERRARLREVLTSLYPEAWAT